jgi:mRNA interferase MazF
MNRGDIVIVDFPFSDGSGSRVRPALIVQADDLNRSLNATILAMITTSQNRNVGHPCQLIIDAGHPDYAASGLRTDSLIQGNVLATRRKTMILRTIGKLSAATMLEVDKCIVAALSIQA